jgi:dihydrofolate synthase/folylpolyglutamate synthase
VTGPDQQWTLADWLRWQESLNPRAIELGLERARAVAQRLGLLDFSRPTLTIAGTNGKGSSATLAALILQESSYRVGLFTSPHLLHYNERVAINGTPASDADLCRAFLAIEHARGDTRLTYFEFGTLAALWLFREAGVDAQVLEVGLGGRLDAVNIVDADVALITNIGLDHTDWLGPDRRSIGFEKAGILRSGRPAVCVDDAPPDTILQHAKAVMAPLLLLHRDFDFSAGANGWNWRGPGGDLHDLPMPGLRGAMQLRNAAGVIAALRQLSLRVTEAAIRRALPALKLPARYQRIGDVVLDVAHNAEAAAVLADNLLAEHRDGRNLLVLGMLSDKPVEAVGHVLARCAQRVFVGTLPGPRGLSAGVLVQRLQGSGLDCIACADIPAAFAQARSEAQPGDWVVVTGSFLSVAAVAEIVHG